MILSIYERNVFFDFKGAWLRLFQERVVPLHFISIFLIISVGLGWTLPWFRESINQLLFQLGWVRSLTHILSYRVASSTPRH